MALAGREERAGQAQRPWPPFMLRLGRKSSAKSRLSERICFFTHLKISSLMTLPDATRNAGRCAAPRSSAEILTGAANPYHALSRRVSAAGLAPTSGEVVTQFQSDSSRTDSPVRILHAQPRSREASSFGTGPPYDPAGPRMRGGLTLEGPAPMSYAGGGSHPQHQE